MKKNKYETGEKDKWNNRQYDFAKVFNDLKKVVLGKAKFTQDLYDVMYLRFTIAHYNIIGWLQYYNGNWAELAEEIQNHAFGGFSASEEAPFEDIRKFLCFHDKDIVEFK